MSKKYTLQTLDWKKIGIGALIALGGTLLTYFQDVFAQIDFGEYQMLAVAINSVIINIIRKFLQGDIEIENQQ